MQANYSDYLNIGGFAVKTTTVKTTTIPSVNVISCPEEIDSYSEAKSTYYDILNGYRKKKYSYSELRDYMEWYSVLGKNKNVVDCSYKMQRSGGTIEDFLYVKVLEKPKIAEVSKIPDSSKVDSGKDTITDYVWVNGQLVARIK